MDANRALAPSLMLEFRQSTLRAMGPLETESLAALRELGFRFCMDSVTDLRMEPRDLGERGIRFVKVPASLLLDEAGSAGSDIHAADLSDLLGRFGISLIAERIESETQVVDLLEYDVRFGQGFLFSQPRPVRAEALRGAAASDRAAGPSRPGRARNDAKGRSGRIGRRALIATPSLHRAFLHARRRLRRRAERRLGRHPQRRRRDPGGLRRADRASAARAAPWC